SVRTSMIPAASGISSRRMGKPWRRRPDRSVGERLEELEDLLLAVGEDRRHLEAPAELLVGLVDRERLRLRHGGLEQRAARRAHVDRPEVAAVLPLRDVGEAEALEVALERVLRGEV